jgi:hypothetical protein
MAAALTVSLLVFLYGGSNSNNDVDAPLCRPRPFSSLTALGIQFIRLIDRVLPPCALSAKGFISP